MSQDSTVSVAATAKPAAPTNETIATTFGEFAKVAQKALIVALKGGVNASAIMAVVAFKVALFHGTKAQTHFLLFGTDKPENSASGPAKLWRAGYALAGHWRFAKALPESIAGANSEETAFVAACDWLESEGITSVDALETWLAKAKGVADTTGPKKTKTPLPERFGKAIAKAEKESDLSVVDASRVATLMLKSMSLANAQAFCVAAAEFKAASDAAIVAAKAKADAEAIAKATAAAGETEEEQEPLENVA